MIDFHSISTIDLRFLLIFPQVGVSSLLLVISLALIEISFNSFITIFLSLKVTQYFIEFTSNGYWLFLALENVLHPSIATQSLCSIFPIVIILTAMAYSCYQSAENSQHTGVLIHKIERDINNELQNSLVIIHVNISL